MSEWQDIQQKLNTKLRDLLKNNKAKTRKLSELSKTEQNRLTKPIKFGNRNRWKYFVITEWINQLAFSEH